MFSRLLSTVLIIYFLAIPAFAESLTLEQAIDTAIQNNPQLKAAKARLGVSDAEIKTAGARPNPMVVSDNGIAEDTYRAGIEQTIELGGKRRKRIAVAKAQLTVVQSEIDQAWLELRANVRRAYTRLYLTQEQQKALEEILSGTEKLLSVSQKQEQAGDVSQLDVLQADISVVNAKNDLQTLVNQRVEARNHLNSLLNQPLDTSVALSPPTLYPTLLETPAPSLTKSSDGTLQASVAKTDFSLDKLIETALSHRPEMLQNERQMAVTERQLSLAKVNRIPNLSLTAGPDIVIPGGGDEGGKAFGAFIIGTMELPVWNRQQGPIQKALAEQAQLQQEQIVLKNKITLEVTNAYNAFYANQDRVMRYETELFPKAQTVAEKSRRSFEEGKSSILIPLLAQKAYTNTRLGYLQAMMDLQNAISDLERAVGTGL
ncbi:MAG: TolC family protein [Vampirovibrionales bacterium]|nr:TolC family protein [Vampirovibrionales bacterium]